MKKLVLAAAFALAATGLSAGSMDEPEMESEMEPMMEPMVEEPAHDEGMGLLPVLLLVLLGAAALG